MYFLELQVSFIYVLGFKDLIYNYINFAFTNLRQGVLEMVIL